MYDDEDEDKADEDDGDDDGDDDCDDEDIFETNTGVEVTLDQAGSTGFWGSE